MIAIRGASSAIAQALLPLLPADEKVWEVARRAPMPPAVERYLFCQGAMVSLPITEQTDREIALSFLVNAGQVIQACSRILNINDRARICVVGSESGYRGSFDESYAAAKAGLHAFVETKRLRTPDQQLVCIAPSIIADSGMTLRRTDAENLERKRLAHPKQRFLEAVEVARLIHHVLYVDGGYLSGVVVRMNGGSHT